MEIIFILFGLIAGWFLRIAIAETRNVGILEIDMTNKYTHYYRLELTQKQYSEIPKKKIAKFKVKTDGHFASVGNTAINGNY